MGYRVTILKDDDYNGGDVLDTGTHLVIGLGLAGLAYNDPVVASDAAISTAVFIGTVIGSQAPDFDALMRLKNNAAYIKNHRGLTHSIPAIVLWTLLITAGLSLFIGGLPILHVGLWVFIAVGFHVFTDLFNTYGTQALRPFSDKWISWNIIHIFDPLIFISHLAAILMWSVQLAPPATIFAVLYVLIAIYYVWRTLLHWNVALKLPLRDTHRQAGDLYYAIPTVHQYTWNILKKKTDGSFVLGEWKNNELSWIDSVSCMDHPAIEASKNHPDIASFLYFSSFACAEVKPYARGYEVRWVDVRYRHRKQYPFVGVLLLNKQLEPLDSYVGWLSDERLKKKLHANLTN